MVGQAVGALLPEVFKWARAVNPVQPVTSGVWDGVWDDPKKRTPIVNFQLENSDIISFHNYGNPQQFEDRIDELVPLGRPIICTEYLARPEDIRNSLIDLVEAPNLKGLPPTTIVTDEIDPLRSEGMTLAERLKAAGVPVESMDYAGVTHEFFGMGAVVAKARQAQDFVNGRLRAAFDTKPGV